MTHPIVNTQDAVPHVVNAATHQLQCLARLVMVARLSENIFLNQQVMGS